VVLCTPSEVRKANIPQNIGEVSAPIKAQTNPRLPQVYCFFNRAKTPTTIARGTKIGANIKMLIKPKIKEAIPRALSGLFGADVIF